MAKNIDSLSKQEPSKEVAPAKPAPAATAPPAATPISTPMTKDEPVKSDDSFESLFPEPTVVIEGPPAWIWWLLLLIGSVLLGFAGYRLTNGRLDTLLAVVRNQPTPTVSPSSSPTPTATPATPTPSPTPAPTATPSKTPLDKSNITLRITNGTTTAGAAGGAKTTLEKAGFKVKSVGNAKTQNYTKTYIYYQKTHLSEAELVQKSLTGYAATLEESTEADPDMVLVVIGPK